jgi:hypothetical protein
VNNIQTSLLPVERPAKRRCKRNKKLSIKNEKKFKRSNSTHEYKRLKEELARYIFEEYDEAMMKAVDYVDDFCIFENDASITDSVLVKYREDEEVEEINNIEEISLEKPKQQSNIIILENSATSRNKSKNKRERKINKIRKIQEKVYKVEQNNNNIVVNLDEGNVDTEERLKKEKLCFNCKMSNSQVDLKNISYYDELLTFFKFIADKIIKDKENMVQDPTFQDNRKKLDEYCNENKVKSQNEFSNTLSICLKCSYLIMAEKNGIFKLVCMINQKYQKEGSEKNILNNDLGFMNDKNVESGYINLALILEELKGQIMLLERFTAFQKYLVIHIFSQCDEYISKSQVNFNQMELTINTLGTYYSMLGLDTATTEMQNYQTFKNLHLCISNLFRLFNINVEVLKSHFCQFLGKYENQNTIDEQVNIKENIPQYNGMCYMPPMNFNNNYYQMLNYYPNNTGIQEGEFHEDRQE